MKLREAEAMLAAGKNMAQVVKALPPRHGYRMAYRGCCA